MSLKVCKELRYEWVRVGRTGYILRCQYKNCRKWANCPHGGQKQLSPTTNTLKQ